MDLHFKERVYRKTLHDLTRDVLLLYYHLVFRFLDI